MSSRRSKPRYSKRVLWEPTPLILAHDSSRVSVLYLHREESGEKWWGDGSALFRGNPPSYLADRSCIAKPPENPSTDKAMAAAITAARDTPEAPAFSEPIASYSYEANGGESTTVPVDVFAAAGAPEIHVDARYVTHARRTFPICTFWRGVDAVVVRDRDGALVGIIQRRRDEPRPRQRRGTP